MTPDQITIIVVYLGAGCLTLFSGDWKKELKDFHDETQKEETFLSEKSITVMISLIILWEIIVWPYELFLRIRYWIKDMRHPDE